MIDPELLQDAERLLRDFLEHTPSHPLCASEAAADPTFAGVCELLARRMARAQAEDFEIAGLGAPTRPRRERQSELLRDVLERDLARAPVAPPGRMVSQCDELILVQDASGAPSRASAPGHRYAIHDTAGRELGEVEHAALPAAPGRQPASILDLSDLCWKALDRTTGRSFWFRRAGDHLHLLDAAGAQIGFVHFKAGAPLEGFKILSSLDRGMMQVKRNPARPYLLSVHGNVGDEIGTLERRFVGLGPFLRDMNQIAVRVQSGKVSPGQRWGLIAAALLAGVDDE
jgi:hypothetical protein